MIIFFDAYFFLFPHPHRFRNFVHIFLSKDNNFLANVDNSLNWVRNMKIILTWLIARKQETRKFRNC